MPNNHPIEPPERIKPCPFCGATAGDIKLSRGHGYIIGCGACQGQQFAMGRDEAVRLWNTRVRADTVADVPKLMLEKVREMRDNWADLAERKIGPTDSHAYRRAADLILAALITITGLDGDKGEKNV